MLKNNKITIMVLALIGMAFGTDADPVAVAAASSMSKGLAGIGAGCRRRNWSIFWNISGDAGCKIAPYRCIAL